MFWCIFFWQSFATDHKLTGASWPSTHKVFFIPTCKLIYLVKLQSFHFASIKSQSLSAVPLPPPPAAAATFCLPATFHFSSLSIIYLLQSWWSPRRRQTYSCLMVVCEGFSSPACLQHTGSLTACGENSDAGWVFWRGWGWLSGMAGLRTIARLIETAAHCSTAR